MQLMVSIPQVFLQPHDAIQQWWYAVKPQITESSHLQETFSDLLTPDEMTVRLLELEMIRRVIADLPYPPQVERPRYYLLNGLHQMMQALTDYQLGYEADAARKEAQASEYYLYFQISLRLLGLE